MMTHEQADNMLGKRDQRKLEYATWLRRSGDDFEVIYHETAIVTIHPDGTYTLNNGGFFTTNTKRRINEYGPATIEGRCDRNCGRRDYPSPFGPSIFAESKPGGDWMVHPKQVINTNYYGLRPNLPVEWEEGIVVDSMGRSLDHMTEV